MTELEQRAMRFAQTAHRTQLRKYTKLPYITHPGSVAEIVSRFEHDEEMLAAAWLHDVVEDCGVTFPTIERDFGYGVYMLVYWLTDVSKPEDGNRAKRKEMDRLHIAVAPKRAKTIKLADIYDNTSSIVEHDPDFAKVYLHEKWKLLQVLTDGDHLLWNYCYNQLQNSAAGLGIYGEFGW